MAKSTLPSRGSHRVAFAGDLGRVPPQCVLSVAFVELRAALAKARLEILKTRIAEVGGSLRPHPRQGRGTRIIRALPIGGVAS